MERSWLEAIRKMKDRGYVVCVFTPKQLKGVDPYTVEYRLSELAKDYIDCLTDMEEEEA